MSRITIPTDMTNVFDDNVFHDPQNETNTNLDEYLPKTGGTITGSLIVQNQLSATTLHFADGTVQITAHQPEEIENLTEDVLQNTIKLTNITYDDQVTTISKIKQTIL